MTSENIIDGKEWLVSMIMKTGNKYCDNFVIDEDNKTAFNSIYCWLSGIQTEEINPERGLAFFGSFGTGKDIAMKIAMELSAHPVLYLKTGLKRSSRNWSAQDLRDEIALCIGKEDIIKRFSLYPLCISDLGNEEKKLLVFGNEINIIERIICSRYDIWQRRKMSGDKSNYLFTHFTTNLSPEMLKENYGERVVDRIKEMFNIITFYGKSRRK